MTPVPTQPTRVLPGSALLSAMSPLRGNPNLECRNPKQIRIPNTETASSLLPLPFPGSQTPVWERPPPKLLFRPLHGSGRETEFRRQPVPKQEFGNQKSRRFRSLGIWYSDLFRISRFGFRISA